MTSPTWTFSAVRRLLGCGVDSEKIERFRKMAAEERPLPLVFTEREVRHARTLPDPAAALCACLACKEAVLKALGEAYNFVDCEFFPDMSEGLRPIELADGLRRDRSIGDARAMLRLDQAGCGELIVVAYLFRLRQPPAR